MCVRGRKEGQRLIEARGSGLRRRDATKVGDDGVLAELVVMMVVITVMTRWEHG